MKAFLPVIVLLLMRPVVFSQVPPGDTLGTAAPSLFAGNKPRYGISLGSEFFTMAGFGSAWSTSVTPRFSYPAGRRFLISAGISLTRTWYDLSVAGRRETAGNDLSGTVSTARIFISGSYRLSDRISLSGTAFGILPLERSTLSYNPFEPISSKGAKGVDFRVGYKVSRNAFIEAGFRYSNGLSPYENDLFNYGSPLTPCGFQNGYGSPRW